ncbi:restriction endonuclease subunit S [Streptomyces sp. NPDC056160]|uniref:restriction endonuclease subunit S n=1 Tax=Streptomyces sp. NPDC056160 TaxID=3345731 RepID=UPI0035DFC5CF
MNQTLTETGNEWAPVIPAHWRLSRLRREVVIAGGQVDPTSPEWRDVTLIAPNHIESGTGRVLSRETAAEQGASSGKYRVLAGQIIYSKIRPALNKATIATEDCLCSADMYPLTVLGRTDKRYALYQILARPFHRFASVTSLRVKMPKINREDLADAPWLLPPLEEQTAIAGFLNRELSGIDEMVAEQQSLVEMLRARRTALVERAVTRGLDASSELRDGNLSWAPEVPAHWRVANVRRFAQMKTGHTPSRSKPEYWENCTIPWMTLADVWQLRPGKEMYVSETQSKISELGLANSAAELLPAGTVMLSRTASVGFSGITPEPMATSQDYWNWVCGPELLPEYLVWLFRAMRQEFNALMMGSTHKTIYQPTAAAIRIPVPPRDEQQAIVDYIVEHTTRIDKLIEESELLVELSLERRSALITAAVTGQIPLKEMCK